jgi:hypothetical protein
MQELPLAPKGSSRSTDPFQRVFLNFLCLQRIPDIFCVGINHYDGQKNSELSNRREIEQKAMVFSHNGF